ncbi:TcfC E-set like domain-containing protein [Photobacterium sanguinicancri]|uniref:TcfC E-set like domain-containing protein n=1 Tax=Photobacterium sanguinicancri TaxID=875932 RepID=UPI003D0C2547
MKYPTAIKPTVLGSILFIVPMTGNATSVEGISIAKDIKTAVVRDNQLAKVDSIVRADEQFLANRKLAQNKLAKAVTDEIAKNSKTARRNELFVSLYGEDFAEQLDLIPDEFLQIVHNQTYSVQIILGGEDIGSAVLSVTPAESKLSTVRLNKKHKDYILDDFDDDKLVSLLESPNLFGGINCGEFDDITCKTDDVIIKAIFDKDTLNLYLYMTSDLLKQEGVSLVNSYYLPPPTFDAVTGVLGYQLNTSMSEYSDNYNLRLKGVISKGVHNIIGNTRFASENSELDDLYYRYDMSGTSLNAGLISTEKLGNNAGFSQSLLDQRQDFIGVEYGSSNRTLRKNEGESLIPVEVIMARAGRVEIFKDGNLIETQYLDAGIAPVSTASFPNGNYMVELRIYDGDRFVRSETKQVIKERVDYTQKYSLFAGYKFDRSNLDYDELEEALPMVGGFYQFPVGSVAALTGSTKIDSHKTQIGLDFKQSLSWFNYSVKGAANTYGDNALSGYLSKSWETYSANLNYRRSTFSEHSKKDRKQRDQDVASLSLSKNFYHGKSVGYLNLHSNYNLRDDKFDNSRLSYNTTIDFWEINLKNVRLEAGFNYGVYAQNKHRDFEKSLDFRVTIPFGLNKSTSVEFNAAYNGQNGYNGDVDLRKTYRDSVMQYASLSARTDEYSSQGVARAGFNGAYARGDVGATVSSNSTSGYSNISGSIGATSQGVGFSSDSTSEAGVLVNINPEAVGKVDLITKSKRVPIVTTPQFVSLDDMNEHQVGFDISQSSKSADSYNVTRKNHRFVAYAGNVMDLQGEFHKTAAVFGQIYDCDKKILPYVKLMSKEKTVFSDESGQFSIEPFDIENTLTVELDDGTQETIEIGELNKPVNFVGKKYLQHCSIPEVLLATSETVDEIILPEPEVVIVLDTYEVQKGDSLYRIYDHYRDRTTLPRMAFIAELYKLNTHSMAKGNVRALRIGSHIQIPSKVTDKIADVELYKIVDPLDKKNGFELQLHKTINA